MKTIIIGASGATGKQLIQKLINSTEITAIISWGRSPLHMEHPKLKSEIIDFDSMEKYGGSIDAAIAFSCLGTTLKAAGTKERQWKIDYEYQLRFAKLCHENGVNSFVLVSALGADSHSKIFYSRMKGELEDAIKKIHFESILIFQPSLLIRPNTDRKGEKISASVLHFITGLGLFKNYKPIKTEALAEAMVKASLSNPHGVHIFRGKEIFELLH